MNTRHPVNPALKEEGGARTAHGLQGRSCDPCVSSLAGSSPENTGKRDGRRGIVEGRKRASWRQSTKGAAEPGEDERSAEEPAERHQEEAPSRSPHPRRCPLPGCGVASAPLTKTVLQAGLGNTLLVSLEWFNYACPVISGWVFSACLPLTFHSGLSLHFFLANKMWSAGRVDCIKGKDLPLRSNIYSYCHASLFIFINLIYYNIMLHKCMHI